MKQLERVGWPALVAIVLWASGPTMAARAADEPALRVARGAGGRSLDPHLGARLEDRPVLHVLYESLVDVNEDSQFTPGLAKSWSVARDGLSVTFRLQPGVKFHDGTDFDAGAVKWNIERVMDPATKSEHQSRFIEVIGSIDVLDRHTVRINLKQAFPPLLSVLIDRPGLMVSPTAARKFGADFARNPVGTGPFRFVEWVPGNRVVLEKFAGYWQPGKPLVGGMTFLDVPEPAVRLAKLRAGELDLIYDVGAKDVAALAGEPMFRIVESRGMRFDSIQLRVDAAPFDNRALREAIAFAIDRNEIHRVIYHGTGQPSGKLFAAGWWASPDYAGMPYAPERARQKLIEAGYPNGVNLVLHVPSASDDLRTGELVQAQLAKVGIRVKIQLVDPNDHYVKVLRGEIPFTVPMRWTPYTDPHELAWILFHSKGYANSSKYRNPGADKLLEAGLSSYEEGARRPAYRDAERMIVEDASYIFYHFTPRFAAHRSTVTGFQWMPNLIPRLREMGFQPR
jgi:peptide/nickel transport system substrate-binding protein